MTASFDIRTLLATLINGNNSMEPTKTRGICARCNETNRYTRTNCVRCNARLAWAFLIDGKEDTPVVTPADRFFNRLFFGAQDTKNRKINCRFCDEPIAFDEKICPHCGRWLASTDVSRKGGSLVHSEAPEIKRLLEQNKKRKL